MKLYALEDFSMYLMPKQAVSECPPCQSDTLPSVFEDDDETEPSQEAVSVLSKVNKVLRKVLVRSKCPAHSKSPYSPPKFLLPSRLRSLTLSRRSSRSLTNSLHSKISN